MKIYKFVIGILLFAVPITFHVASGDYLINAPLGTLYSNTGGVSFTVHTFQLYTNEASMDFAVAADSLADIHAFNYFRATEGFGTILAVEGLLTIMILFGLALYIVSSIIDIKVLNIISDLLMVGFAIMSLICFLNWSGSPWGASADFGIPIFTIIAGLLGVGGAIHSGIELKK
ncbi:MAG: hypothetical protein ACTSQF_12245 [Candidatus Heimdallarchaeaceae archaeon]